jgi:hypothetical protein
MGFKMKLSRKTVEYLGIIQPSTADEIKIEILGLKNLIKQAEEIISRHEQAMELASAMGRERSSMINNIEEEEKNEYFEEPTNAKEPPPLVR